MNKNLRWALPTTLFQNKFLVLSLISEVIITGHLYKRDCNVAGFETYFTWISRTRRGHLRWHVTATHMWHLWSGCLHAVWKEAVRGTRLCRRRGEARGTSLCGSRWAQVGYIRLHLWWWRYTWRHWTHWRHGTFHGRLHWIWKTYFESIIPVAVSFKNVSTKPLSSCNLKIFPYLFPPKRSLSLYSTRILLPPKRTGKMLVKNKLDTNKLPVNDPTELGEYDWP